MGWKELPNWKRGAFVGIILSVLFFVVIFVAGLAKDWPTGDYGSFIIFGFISSLFEMLQIGIFVILVGALIGWIVGKVKEKKK